MEDDETETNEKTVPVSRLKQETKKYREALAAQAELETRLAEAEKRAASFDATAKKLADLESTYATEKATWTDERAVFQAGVTDPEAISVGRHLYGQLDPKGRPDFAAWMKGHVEAPDTAPRALRGYLQPDAAKADAGKGTGGGKAAAGTGTKAAGAGSGKAAADTVGNAAGRAAGASKYEARDVRAIRERAQQTGDWTEYKAIRDVVLAQVQAPAEPAE